MAVSEGNAHNVMNVMTGQHFDRMLDALNQDQCTGQYFHLLIQRRKRFFIFYITHWTYCT